MRVLIIEDELDLASALRRALQDEGFACDVAHDGPTGVFHVSSWEYDVVVLDLMLPGMNGRGVLRQLRRKRRTPVLILTARDAVAEKVELLDAGADDYLTKPFVMSELVSRLRALVRRAAGEPRPTLELGELEIDTVARRIARDGTPVEVSPKEFALLEYLVLHRGELVTRTMIYDHLWGSDEDTCSNVVDVYVSNLRRKLGKDLVRTRRGEGYILDA